MSATAGVAARRLAAPAGEVPGHAFHGDRARLRPVTPTVALADGRAGTGDTRT